MAKYTQANRPLRIETPLGADAVLLDKVTGSEGLSELFQFELELLAEKPLPFDRLLNQKVAIVLDVSAGGPRYLNGIVSRLTQSAQVRAAQGDISFIRYRASVVPHFWLWTKNVQSRIFQHLPIPEVLAQVLHGLTVQFQLKGVYEPRKYCVQYRESDFAFASRLMEQEGIYYYFQHTEKNHTLIVTDSQLTHADLPGPQPIVYDVVEGGFRGAPRIHAWEKTQEVLAGKCTLRDYSFELPAQNLEVSQTVAGEEVKAGTVSHKATLGSNTDLEVYEPVGGYAKRFDGIDQGGGEQSADLQKIFEDNRRTLRIRWEQDLGQIVRVRGAANHGLFVPGSQFTLSRHFDADGVYLLTRVEHVASLEGAYTTRVDAVPTYQNRFECIPAGLQYRPPRRTAPPRVEGTQTAVVVGPPGEEIFTDKYGRIKVQFHWDRQGQNNASSSCWLRVAQPWAGETWGAMTLPRVGQEVVIAFEEGDLDRPIVLGSVYNAKQMPPYQLPGARFQSGFVSSTQGGGTGNYHEFRMEDTAGQEQIFLHSENHLHQSAEKSMSIFVGWGQGKSGEGGGSSAASSSGSGGGAEAPEWLIKRMGEGSEMVYGNNYQWVVGANEEIIIGANNEVIIGENGEAIVGANIEVVVGANLEAVIGPQLEFFWGSQGEWIKGNLFEKIDGDHMEILGGTHYELVQHEHITIVGNRLAEWEKASEAGTEHEEVYDTSTTVVDKTALTYSTNGDIQLIANNGKVLIIGDSIELVATAGDIVKYVTGEEKASDEFAEVNATLQEIKAEVAELKTKNTAEEVEALAKAAKSATQLLLPSAALTAFLITVLLAAGVAAENVAAPPD